ncbi:tetratricopeptide repeat protein [Amycolatopsis thailandensis]|uniref:tetratricopeptide repeat protein n=1 Tax=Amycolatopsis thailandensis TaxID=589330 RepID=UPI00364095A7
MGGVSGDFIVQQAGTSGAAAVVSTLSSSTRDAQDLFVGRVEQVQNLLELLAPVNSDSSAVVVSAIAGMGGIGKTALARHTAYLAADRAWFAGGVLFVDLRGYSPDDEQVLPSQVFAPALRLLGVPSEDAPTSIDEQAAIYHQVLGQLAASGQRVLLVFDNAASSRQVADLLPRQATHRALITTRDVLHLPAAQQLELDVLPSAEALQLLTGIITRRSPADDRVTREPKSAARLVEICGTLPLAVEIVASILADDPGLRFAELLSELTDVDGPGAHTLQYGELALATTFDVSWRRLQSRAPHAATLLPLLTLNPGPDFAANTAAALSGHSRAHVMPWLRTLRQASLLRLRNGRWSMHDLIRLHAGSHLEESLREAALQRLLEHYGHTADIADDHLRARPGDPTPGEFSSRDDALAWFDTEHANLLNAVTLALDSGRYEFTVHFVPCLTTYLSWRHHLTDQVTVSQQELAAAQALDSPELWTAALLGLGTAFLGVGRFDDGISALRHVVTIYRSVGERVDEAMALNNLGHALSSVRQFDDAIIALQDAVTIFRDTGDRNGEGSALINLGAALGEVGRIDDAITNLREVVAIHRDTGDRNGEGRALTSLGVALQMADRLHDSAVSHREAIAIHRETGDRASEALALNGLGLALANAQRLDEAIATLQESVAIQSDIGNRPGEGSALNNLAATFEAAGRLEAAKATAQRALAVFHEVGDAHWASEVQDWLDALR